MEKNKHPLNCLYRVKGVKISQPKLTSAKGMWDHCLLAAGLVAACRLAVTWNLYGVCSARAADPPKQRPLIQGFQGQEHLGMSAFPWELQSVASSLALELCDLAPTPASSR